LFHGLNADAEKIAEVLLQSRKTVAMTGAGMSTRSGVHDFRDSSGIWRNYDPSKMTMKYFREDPAYLWGFIYPFLLQREMAEPNAAHQALVDMERIGALHTIITQNLDRLHQEAGSERVLEFYGGLTHCYCIDCGHWVEIESSYILSIGLMDEEAPGAMKKPLAPGCEKCGGAMMPNIPLYDTPLNVRNIFAVTSLASSADLLLIAGTSLQFAPIGFLPNVTRYNGGIVAIINDSPTTFDKKADILCRGRVENILPEIIRATKIKQAT